MRTTIEKIAQSILEMYRSLAGEKAFLDILNANSLIGHRLRLLKEVVKTHPTVKELSQVHRDSIHDALLDAVALQSAAGERNHIFANLTVTDPIPIGTRSELREKLMDSNPQNQLDWHFQLLIQGWASLNGLGPLIDLRRQKLLRSGSVCDFLLTHENPRELLECKRIHPGTTQSNTIAHVLSKFPRLFRKAADQLHTTARKLHIEHVCRHLLIDLSGYADATPVTIPDVGRHPVSILGFTEQAINSILQATSAAALNVGIDKITLCWRDLVLIDGYVRALRHQGCSRLASDKNSLLEYRGWTIESYEAAAHGTLLRVAATTRSVGWLATALDNWTQPPVMSQFTAL
jgi:hypothetical protein